MALFCIAAALNEVSLLFSSSYLCKCHTSHLVSWQKNKKRKNNCVHHCLVWLRNFWTERYCCGDLPVWLPIKGCKILWRNLQWCNLSSAEVQTAHWHARDPWEGTLLPFKLFYIGEEKKNTFSRVFATEKVVAYKVVAVCAFRSSSLRCRCSSTVHAHGRQRETDEMPLCWPLGCSRETQHYPRSSSHTHLNQ